MTRQIDEQSATYPKAGDYWSEMLSPTCIVLEVDGEAVTLCKTKKYHAAEGWEWDLDTLVVTTRQQFKKWLSYDTCPGYWARVSYSPEFHKMVLKEYQSKKSSVAARAPLCGGQQLEMDFNPPFLSTSSISSPHTQSFL